LTVGVLSDNPIIALWGQVVLGMVALAYPLCLRDAGRVWAGGLTVDCDAPTGPGGGIVAGGPFEVPLTIYNRGARRIGRLGVTMVTSSAVDCPDPEDVRAVGPGAELEWRVQAHALRTGPAVIHGLYLRVVGPTGMFRATVYKPLDVPLTVLPRTASRRSRVPRLLTAASDRDALTPTAQPVRGLGSDIRELRDHHHGDPFKHIAWKATARARRLIVKEFESEVTRSVYVLLDIGPSMRWGAPGQARVDVGIDLAFHLARTVNTGRDRFGLVTFDQEVFGFTRAATGHAMPQRVIAHLLEVHAVVHKSFTDAMTTGDLVSRVAEFIRVQESVDLSLPRAMVADDGPDLGIWDKSAVMSRVYEHLERNAAELKVLSHYFSDPAEDADEAALRTYCRLRGIELPYRTDALPGPKEVGLERAIQQVIADRGGTHTLVVVTDLTGVHNAAQLMPAVRLARRHCHRLVFIVPDADLAASDADTLERRLHVLFDEDNTARRSRIAVGLRAQGVSVYDRSSALGTSKRKPPPSRLRAAG